MNQTALDENAQKWFELVKDFLKSGQDRATYCDKNNVNQQRIIYWLGRYYEISKGLIPANIVNPNTSQMVEPQSLCDLKLVSGHEISINKNEAITPELSKLIQSLAKVGNSTNAATI